jgi:hypothetical protein
VSQSSFEIIGHGQEGPQKTLFIFFSLVSITALQPLPRVFHLSRCPKVLVLILGRLLTDCLQLVFLGQLTFLLSSYFVWRYLRLIAAVVGNNYPHLLFVVVSHRSVTSNVKRET